MPDRQLERLLNQRKVYCTMRDEGCTWVGEMEKLQRHLKPSQMLFLPSKDAPALCEYVPIRCTLCKVLYRKQDDHMSVCQMRQVSCDFCEDYRGTFQNRSLHYNVCPMFPVPCPNACDLDTFKRKDLEDHLDKDCPLQNMKCEYQDAGCEVSMLRKDMPKHLESYVKEHLALASAKYRKVTAKYKALKEQTCGSNLKDIQYILITNMSADTNGQHLSSRFGQFGYVSYTRMIPSLNAAAVKFSNKAKYGSVLRSSRLYGINLLKQRLRITPIYHSHAAAAFPHQEVEEVALSSEEEEAALSLEEEEEVASSSEEEEEEAALSLEEEAASSSEEEAASSSEEEEVASLSEEEDVASSSEEEEEAASSSEEEEEAASSSEEEATSSSEEEEAASSSEGWSA